LDNVTNDAQTKAAVVPNTAPAAGQIPVGNAGGTAYAPTSLSGDATMTSAGVVTNAKINGIAVTGTPSIGYVPTATSSSAATWQAPSGGTITASGPPTSGQFTKFTSATNITGITPGTGVETALGVNTGSAGAFVVNGGALGTPSSGTLTNATGLPVAGITSSTSTALGVGSLEIGNASDTTLARVSAGVASVEGATIFTTTTKADVLEAATFASDAGSTDDYAATLSPAITAYVTGAHYRFKANTANTGAATINLNSLGAKTIVKVAGGITTALATNDIRSGQWVDVVYDGANMQMQSTLGNAASGGTPGGSDTQVQFNDSGAFGGDSGFYYNKTTDTLVVSGAQFIGNVGDVQSFAPLLNIGSDSNPVAAAFYSFSTTALNGPQFFIRRSRGSTGTPSNVLSGDTLGLFDFGGRGNAGWPNGARISAVTTQDWSSGNAGTALVFATNLTNGAFAERARISGGGNLLVGTTSDTGLTAGGLAVAGAGVTGLLIVPQATGSGVDLTATGSDSNIPIYLKPKGTQAIYLSTDGATNTPALYFYRNNATIAGVIGSAGTTNSLVTGSVQDDMVIKASQSKSFLVSTDNGSSAAFAVVGSTGKVTVAKGVTADGGGIKHSRVTTGSVSAGSTALVTVTWSTAFADANYTASASVVDSTTSSLSLSVVHIESVAAGSMTVRVLNNAVGSLTGTLHVIAMHD